MNARKFPRTLSQAFGPYTDNVIHEPPKAVFDSWLKWRQEHAKPMDADTYQRDAIAEHATRRLPNER